MAKRRRRKITIKNSSLIAFFAFISLFLFEENSAYQHQNPYRYNNNQQQQKHHYTINQAQLLGINQGVISSLDGSRADEEKPTPPSQLRSSHTSSFIGQQNFQESSKHDNLNYRQQQLPNFNNPQPSHYGTSSVLPTAYLCSNLPTHMARQLKLCKIISHSPGADDVVSLGASQGLAECRSQFRHDRWNCTHTAGDHQLLTSELAQSIGNPESGFIHAIAAAGIVHSIATACSVGNLSDCTCDKSRVGTITAANRNEPPALWKWGGCSNNIRHGMMFAKHLVELLDAVHQHSRSMHLQQHHQNQNHHHHQYRQQKQHNHHHLGKRSTIILGRDHLSNQRPPETMMPTQAGGDLHFRTQRDFCQQNQNISQAKHHELIKSLLSRNSLEKHQEFRLAMNMHNNKIGRMAVAKNMELHCRCHGLSGTCSLKTCWLTLPSFQVIGEYLKKKYEKSVHLPKAVNLNKLIPMMDRQEISAILSSHESGHSASPPAPSEPLFITSTTTTEFIPQDHLQQQQSQLHPPEYAALVHNGGGGGGGSSESTDVDNHSNDQLELAGPITTTPTSSRGWNLSQSASMTGDDRSILYGRHKPHQLQTTLTPTVLQPVEVPRNLEPLSQQQYQALLREMKLCNMMQPPLASTTTTTTGGSHLQTRDLTNQQQQKHQHLKRQQQQQQQQHLLNGHQTKQANQQLSHLLTASDKDELIHLHKSPNYCDADLKHGFVGIQSRVCTDIEGSPDNCDRLCCSRGHRRVILHTERSCNCKFEWCCFATCKMCYQETEVLQCN